MLVVVQMISALDSNGVSTNAESNQGLHVQRFVTFSTH